MSTFLRLLINFRPLMTLRRSASGLVKNEGFTLVEVLVAVAITSLLVPAITSSMIQIMKGTDRNNNENVALADMDNVSSWISRDLTKAESTDLVDCALGTQTSVRIDWLDQSTWASENPNHYANYYIEPGTTKLMRDQDGSLATVGRHVTALTAYEVVASGTVTLNLTTTAEGTNSATKTLYIIVTPRAVQS